MNKNLFFIFLTFLLTLPINAQETLTDKQSTKINKTPTCDRDPNSRISFRLGKINLTGKYLVENLEDFTTSSISDLEQKGWEFSIVGGVDTRKGFDFRPMMTFQWFNIIKSGDNMASNMMMLGEFEFVYNINQYFAPLVGFNTGVGITDFKEQNTDAGYGAQFALFLGISGEVYKHFGYYVKVLATKKTSYFTHEETNMYMTGDIISAKYGLSYKF